MILNIDDVHKIVLLFVFCYPIPESNTVQPRQRKLQVSFVFFFKRQQFDQRRRMVMRNPTKVLPCDQTKTELRIGKILDDYARRMTYPTCDVKITAGN